MIKELKRKIETKEISVPELYSEYLGRIKKADKEINSFITVCGSIPEINEEDISLPLFGIPISVKDNICTRDIKTTCASKMLLDFVPCYDAAAVRRLKKSGALIIGKTNMDEFAMGSGGDSSYFGAVHNPYNIKYSAGGSSAGAAASVAAGFCAAALGSDTGGSVRLPAAFCGVTGLNPTYGRIPRYGLIAFASSLDRIGIIANSSEDAGYILNIIAGKDESDMTSSDCPCEDCSDIHKSNLKIGISEEFFTEADSETVKACMAAVDFYKSIGAQIVSVSLPSLEYAVAAYYLISSAEAASNLSRFDGIKYGYSTETADDYKTLISETRDRGFGNEVKRRIMLGNYALSADRRDMYYQKAVNTKYQIIREYGKMFEKCDIFLSPTAPHPADLSAKKAARASVYAEDIFTVPSSLAGLPSISTVCGYSQNGLPIGMSLTGKAFCEGTIIKAADLFEKSFKRREAIIW